MKYFLVATVFLSSFLIAATDDDYVAARRAALELAGAWSNDGFKIRDGHWDGTLETGKSQILQVNLFAGNQYWFSAAANQKDVSLGVHVFDESGAPVKCEMFQDASRAACGFSPQASGPYFVKVTLLKGAESAFSLVYSYK
jgi:hypothetical protein